MRSLRLRVPPLNSLVAFEATARHLSITRASQELAISREAVSRQIRILEDHLGTKLFRRLYRALELTQEGEALAKTARQCLETLAQAAEQLRDGAAAGRLTVTATVAITTYWLTPRLPKFRAAFPEIQLRVNVSDTPLDLGKHGIDVGLRYGYGKWPGTRAIRLFDVESMPVCAPAYLDLNLPIVAPPDLLHHTLLNLDGAPHAEEDWFWLLAEAGVPKPHTPRLLGFDNYANVIQAAIDGQGVAIGFSGILDDLLGNGTLVAPLPRRYSKQGAVYLIRPEKNPSREAKAFVDWVTDLVEKPGA